MFLDVYKLHKLIVCSRSEFFKRAVSFGGKVSLCLDGSLRRWLANSKQETQTGEIDLPDDDPKAVKLMVQYLYEADYNPKELEKKELEELYTNEYNYDFPHSCTSYSTGKKRKTNSCYTTNVCPHHECYEQCNGDCSKFICAECSPIKGTAAEFLMHTQLYEMADKYHIPDLKYLCKLKFQDCCERFWNDKTFLIAAHHAFSTTPETDKGLRDIVSTTIAEHMELLKKPEVEVLMTEFNGLAFGLLKAKATEYGWVEK